MGIPVSQLKIGKSRIPYGNDPNYIGSVGTVSDDFYYDLFMGGVRSSKLGFSSTTLQNPILTKNLLETDGSNLYFVDNSYNRNSLALASSVYRSPFPTLGRKVNNIGGVPINGVVPENKQSLIDITNTYSGSFTLNSFTGNTVFTVSSGTPWVANNEVDTYYIAYSSANGNYTMLRVNDNTTTTLIFDVSSHFGFFTSFDTIAKIKTPVMQPSTWVKKAGNCFDGINVWNGGTKTNLYTGVSTTYGAFTSTVLGFDGINLWGVSGSNAVKFNTLTNVATNIALGTTLTILSESGFYDGQYFWLAGWSNADSTYYIKKINVYTGAVSTLTLGSFTSSHIIKGFFKNEITGFVNYFWTQQNPTSHLYGIGLAHWDGGHTPTFTLSDVFTNNGSSQAITKGLSSVFDGTFLYFFTNVYNPTNQTIDYTQITLHALNIYTGAVTDQVIDNTFELEYSIMLFDGENLLIYVPNSGQLFDRLYVVNPNKLSDLANNPLYIEIPPVINQAGFTQGVCLTNDGILLGNYFYPYIKQGAKNTDNFFSTKQNTGFSKGFFRKTKTITANYSISSNDYRIMFNAGSITLTLPALAKVPDGQEYHIMNSSTSTLTITLAAQSGETINGSATQSITGGSASRHVFAYTDNNNNSSWKMYTP